MSYNNYLIKVGTYTIPFKYISIDSCNILYSTSDLDSYRDADGVLHRNALSHKIAKFEFSTPYIYLSDFTALMANISAQYTNSTEKKCSVQVYIPEINDYVTQDMYVPDITTTFAQNSKRGFLLNPVRIAFIGY